MRGVDTLHVDSCPLCEIFTKNKITTKLYYPEQDKINETDDFVIIGCKYCKTPIVVVTDHITDIGKEQWGRILYRCKKIFGNGIRLQTRRKIIRDHYHCHINGISRDLKKIPDLRNVKM